MHSYDSDYFAKIEQTIVEVFERIRGVNGYLSEIEVRFLALLAACPTAEGEVLEIGSYQGKSTIVLATAGKLNGRTRVVAVDPLMYRPWQDPLRGQRDCFPELTSNLKNAGVADLVEFHQMRSQELAGKWNRKVRLLWIDGDHSYPGAKTDFDLFAPHLADGAIVALHDTMKHDVGPLRVFGEDILLSNHFGAAGVCGSIGWAQFRSDPASCERFQREKLRIYKRIAQMIPYACLDPQDHGTSSAYYRFLRFLQPHGGVTPQTWFSKVAVCC
jgi:hypothetical protein